VDIGLLLCAANAGVAKLTAAIAAPKISIAIFAMFVLCEWAMLCYPRAEDWVALSQMPSRFREARRIAANIAKLPESVRGFNFPLRCSLNINRGKGGSLWRKPLRK
jgi:hypothetical protein